MKAAVKAGEDHLIAYEEATVEAVCRCAAVATNAHTGDAISEHVLDAEAGPESDAVAEFFGEFIPAVIDGEEQFCGTWNIHPAEYKAVSGHAPSALLTAWTVTFKKRHLHRMINRLSYSGSFLRMFFIASSISNCTSLDMRENS